MFEEVQTFHQDELKTFFIVFQSYPSKTQMPFDRDSAATPYHEMLNAHFPPEGEKIIKAQSNLK